MVAAGPGAAHWPFHASQRVQWTERATVKAGDRAASKAGRPAHLVTDRRSLSERSSRHARSCSRQFGEARGEARSCLSGRAGLNETMYTSPPRQSGFLVRPELRIPFGARLQASEIIWMSVNAGSRIFTFHSISEKRSIPQRPRSGKIFGGTLFPSLPSSRWRPPQIAFGRLLPQHNLIRSKSLLPIE